jgi:hypothetical protein
MDPDATADHETPAHCRILLEQLQNARTGVLGPPEFAHELEDFDQVGRCDLPGETVGGMLRLYTALPP